MFNGSGVAIITPFHPDLTVDYEAFKTLLDFHMAHKTDAVIVCGTTGESATLSHKEHEDLIEFTVKYINKKIPVIAGTGSNETKRAIDLTKIAEETGADGALIVTPYYNKTSQRGLYEHFKSINDACNLPIIMYNVPSRTGLNMSVETAVALSQLQNISGIKEASSNIVQIADIARQAAPDFSVISGNDNETVPILSVGGVGVISVAANVIPDEMSQVVHWYLQGQCEDSKKLFLKILPLCNALFIDVNPIPVKKAAELLNMCAGTLRPPLIEMDDSKTEVVKNELMKLGLKGE